MRPLQLVIPIALALGTSVATYGAYAQVALDVSITAAPPELPVYDQPPLPAPGYIFMPGYWSYGDSGYFWVPGTWVEPPQPGLLWTPGYWGWNGGRYIFNTGYWGPTVGFYGGINYGFGYGGLGYEGGYWRGGSFFYNRAVNNFGGVHVTNVFERNVTNVTVNRVSFNGPNGVQRRPSPTELAASRAPHVPATAMQMQHVQAAQQNRALLASVNHGRPAVLATPRPAAFDGANGPASGRNGAASASAPAPGPHTVTRGAPAGRPGAPLARSGAGATRVESQSAAPHPVSHTAVPHSADRASSQPHETTSMSRPMPPREAAPSGPARAPMRASAGPGPMSHPASAPHPVAAPREAATPRDEKPKR